MNCIARLCIDLTRMIVRVLVSDRHEHPTGGRESAEIWYLRCVYHSLSEWHRLLRDLHILMRYWLSCLMHIFRAIDQDAHHRLSIVAIHVAFACVLVR